MLCSMCSPPEHGYASCCFSEFTYNLSSVSLYFLQKGLPHIAGRHGSIAGLHFINHGSQVKMRAGM